MRRSTNWCARDSEHNADVAIAAARLEEAQAALREARAVALLSAGRGQRRRHA
jgi:hypothetical protein